MKHTLTLLTALLLPLAALHAANPTDLRCEYHENPLGIDVAKPRMGWKMEDGVQRSEDGGQGSEVRGQGSEVRGRKQTAYQLVVSSTPELLAKDQGDLWDSGMVASDQCVHIVYDGKPLSPRQQLHWKVRIKDQDGTLTGWSQPATWVMGVMGAWKSPWIAARDVPMLRPILQTPKWMSEPKGNFVDPSGLGYHAVIAASADTVKWVQVDLGKVMPIQRVRIQTLSHDQVQGFGFPLRYRVELSDDADFSQPRMLEDHTAADVPNPGATWLTVDGQGLSGRYVRLTATKLFSRPANPAEFCFGLRAMEVISGDMNVALKASVQSLDSVELHGWNKSLLTIAQPERRREVVLLRRDVKLDAKPLRALARVSALGFAEFSVNGKKAGNDVTAPAVSDYTRRVFYHVYDVTAHFQAGANALGAVLGNGFFGAASRGWANTYGVGNEPVFSVEVELTMPNGTTTFLTADSSWKCSTAEITFNDFWAAEHQDLRLAQPGWDAPGFGESKWQPVVQVSAPPGVMQANPGTPVRVTEELKPVRVEGNRYFFENMYTGWPVVRASGSAGQEVRVGDHGKNRGIWVSGVGNSSPDFRYVFKGAGEEMLEPRFMVNSVGPVISVDGIEPPPLEAVTIKRAGADLRHTGRFSCSNPFLNRVHDVTRRTHLNYTLDIPMDPSREKAGWTQDVQTMIDSAVYLTDMAALYRRWWTDMQESQLPDGSVGSVAPMIWGGQENCWNDPWWGGMIIYLPYKHYLYYGNKEILETAYEPMANYLKWLASQVDPKDGLLHWSGASDWLEVGCGYGPTIRTPKYLVSTCALYRFTGMMSEISRALGKTAEADAYAASAVNIKDNFNTRLLDPATGLYAGATDSQTSLILPLAFGMVPEDKKALVLQRLVENFHQRGDHLSTGFVGTPYLIATMTDLGLGDLLYKIINQQDYPGWNTLITEGVMKETWESGEAQMPSLGGAIGQWFYKIAGGIRPDPATPGFKNIIIRPAMVGDLTWVKCEYDSNYGRIVSNWTREGDTVSMKVTIPPNTTATVFVPAQDAAGVTESGKPADKAKGVKFQRMENHAAVYAVGSGTYQFKGR